MSYLRVLPRDAFNEANLLKCIGKLTLLIEDRKLEHWSFDYDGGPFEVVQNPNDGSITLANLRLKWKDEEVGFFVPLNSKRPWPLMVCLEGSEDEWLFDEKGEV